MIANARRRRLCAPASGASPEKSTETIPTSCDSSRFVLEKVRTFSPSKKQKKVRQVPATHNIPRIEKAMRGGSHGEEEEIEFEVVAFASGRQTERTWMAKASDAREKTCVVLLLRRRV
jgi:hypothetical protein